jgi:hypothetical protein
MTKRPYRTLWAVQPGQGLLNRCLGMQHGPARLGSVIDTLRAGHLTVRFPPSR